VNVHETRAGFPLPLGEGKGEGLVALTSSLTPTLSQRRASLDQLRLRFGAFGIYCLRRLKSDLTMCAVAERFVRRSSAAAQGDARKIVSRNLVSGGVINIYLPFD